MNIFSDKLKKAQQNSSSAYQLLKLMHQILLLIVTSTVKAFGKIDSLTRKVPH